MHVDKLTNISTMWRPSHLVSPNFELRSLIELCICNSNSTEDKVFAEYLRKKFQNNKILLHELSQTEKKKKQQQQKFSPQYHQFFELGELSCTA